MPVTAILEAPRSSRMPRVRESRAPVPTAVPTPTAIISICTGQAEDAAVSAASLQRATRMLSTMLLRLNEE